MARKRRKRGNGLFLVKDEKTGIYQIRGSVLGQPVRESTRTTNSGLAEEVRFQTEARLRKQQLHGAAAVATFGEAVVDYLEDGGSKDHVTPLNDHFGDMLLSEIDQDKIKKFIRIHYPKSGPQGVNRRVYTPVIAIMRKAASLKKCAMPMFTRPKIEKKTVQHAPDEWVTSFLAGCRIKRLKAIVMALTTTGCRVTEACRLCWPQVDFFRKRALLEVTKSGDPRSIPLCDELVELLRELKVEADASKVVKARVFSYASRFSVNQAIERECERMGLPYYSSHKLGRHAIASRMLVQGHTLKEVQEAVGWSPKSYRLVAETYGHLEQSKAQGLMINASKGVLGEQTDKRTASIPRKPASKAA